MNNELLEKEEKQNSKQKKRRGTALLLLLIVFLILFLLSTALLGARLYDLTTREKYAVDLWSGAPVGELELFRVEYENTLGEITVRGTNADKVVAPGTAVDYDIRLRNNDDVLLEFVMEPSVEYLTADAVPVEFRIRDDYGNYILGSDTHWGNAQDMNELIHNGNIHPGEIYTYHLSWRWVFEVGDEQDAYDTYLGSQDGEIQPGIQVGVKTTSTGNAYVGDKNMTHMAHLRGDSFGCCWCCWLVWFLLLVCLLLTIRNWRMRKQLDRQEEKLEEYEELLQAHGICVSK